MSVTEKGGQVCKWAREFSRPQLAEASVFQHRQGHAFFEPDLVPGADVPDVLLELIACSNENMLAIVDFGSGLSIGKRIGPATEKRAFLQDDRLQAQLNQAY